MTVGLALGIAGILVVSFITSMAVVFTVKSMKLEQKYPKKESILYKFKPNENEHSLDELVEHHKNKKEQYNKALKSGNQELIRKSKPVNYKIEEEMGL